MITTQKLIEVTTLKKKFAAQIRHVESADTNARLQKEIQEGKNIPLGWCYDPVSSLDRDIKYWLVQDGDNLYWMRHNGYFNNVKSPQLFLD